jgi:hypothetical protein
MGYVRTGMGWEHEGEEDQGYTISSMEPAAYMSARNSLGEHHHGAWTYTSGESFTLVEAVEAYAA